MNLMKPYQGTYRYKAWSPALPIMKNANMVSTWQRCRFTRCIMNLNRKDATSYWEEMLQLLESTTMSYPVSSFSVNKLPYSLSWRRLFSFINKYHRPEDSASSDLIPNVQPAKSEVKSSLPLSWNHPVSGTKGRPKSVKIIMVSVPAPLLAAYQQERNNGFQYIYIHIYIKENLD